MCFSTRSPLSSIFLSCSAFRSLETLEKFNDALNPTIMALTLSHGKLPVLSGMWWAALSETVTVKGASGQPLNFTGAASHRLWVEIGRGI